MMIAIALLALATPVFASDPFAGTWTLNSAKTKYTTGDPPKNVTLVIEEQGPNLQVTASGTNADGSPLSVKYTVPIEGGMGTIQEGDFDGISAKRISDHERENSYTKGGKELRTRRMTLSADGKTMNSAVKGANMLGKQTVGVDVYDKQ